MNFARNILDAGDFGTVIVHTGAEVKDAALQEMASVGKESILHKDAARSSHVLGDKAANLWYVASFFHLIFLLFLSFFFPSYFWWESKVEAFNPSKNKLGIESLKKIN